MEQVKEAKEMTVIATQSGEVKLSADVVRRYLVSGGGNISDQEVLMFMSLCKYQKLNPFLREVYIIKYGDSSPAAMVVGIETFLKRAQNNPRHEGHETGISEDGKTAWASVHVKGYKVPIKVEVTYEEYVGLKDEWAGGRKTGEKVVNSMWSKKPRTMLKKVALAQALRQAYPGEFGALYSEEEISDLQEPLPTNLVEAPAEALPKERVASKPETKAPVSGQPVQQQEPKAPKAEQSKDERSGKPAEPPKQEVPAEKPVPISDAEFTGRIDECLAELKTKGVNDAKINTALVMKGYVGNPLKCTPGERKRVLAIMKEIVEDA